MDNPMGVVYFRDLDRVVQDVLELPLDRREGEATKIVRTIFKVIENALKEHKTITVYQFGKFKIKTRKAFIAKFSVDPHLGGAGQLKRIPERHFVHFKPSPDLIKTIKERFPNDS